MKCSGGTKVEVVERETWLLPQGGKKINVLSDFFSRAHAVVSSYPIDERHTTLHGLFPNVTLISTEVSA